MSKSKKAVVGRGIKSGVAQKTVKGEGKFVDRNLMGVNPSKEQFEPTDANPVRQHKRMAGDC
jgi:small ligand-binding sensory domain FIST